MHRVVALSRLQLTRLVANNALDAIIIELAGSTDQQVLPRLKVSDLTFLGDVTGRTRYMVQYHGIGTAGSILNYGAAHN
jgi:hypothetical protein